MCGYLKNPQEIRFSLNSFSFPKPNLPAAEMRFMKCIAEITSLPFV